MIPAFAGMTVWKPVLWSDGEPRPRFLVGGTSVGMTEAAPHWA